MAPFSKTEEVLNFHKKMMSFLIVGGNTATHPEYESCFPYQKKPFGPWTVSFLAEKLTNQPLNLFPPIPYTSVEKNKICPECMVEFDSFFREEKCRTLQKLKMSGHDMFLQ